jgi:predicted DNA-binding protein
VIAIRGCYHRGVSKGEFLLRLDPDMRQRLAEASRKEGMPMSDIIREGIEMRLSGRRKSSSAARKAALLELSDLARRLADGHILMPGAEVPPDPWTGLMDREES